MSVYIFCLDRLSLCFVFTLFPLPYRSCLIRCQFMFYSFCFLNYWYSTHVLVSCFSYIFSSILLAPHFTLSPLTILNGLWFWGNLELSFKLWYMIIHNIPLPVLTSIFLPFCCFEVEEIPWHKISFGIKRKFNFWQYLCMEG